MWADIEHVDGSEPVKHHIQYSCDDTRASIKGRTSCIAFPGIVAFKRKPCSQAKQDEQNVPGKGVDGKRLIGVVEPACVKEGEDASEHAEVHKERKQYLTQSDRLCPWQYEADVHRYAAQLEGKVPPVVVPVIHDKGQAELFPDFADRHCEPAYKVDAVVMETVVCYQNCHLLSVICSCCHYTPFLEMKTGVISLVLCYNTIVAYLRRNEENFSGVRDDETKECNHACNDGLHMGDGFCGSECRDGLPGTVYF